MEKILVTGVNGFVGHHVARELAANGYEVHGLGGHGGPDHRLDILTAYAALDLTDPEATRQIDFTKIQGVIHLAGLAAVGVSFDKPLEYINANIGMEINLFEAAMAQQAFPRFIVVSSGSLYDPKGQLPITEESPVAPTSPYAVSKLGQEHMAQYYTGRGFECVIARPFNHIGPGQGTGFIVPDWAQQIIAAEKGETDKILVGNLDAERDYTDVRDIALGYRLLLEKGRSNEIYNICSGTPRSGNEILKLLQQASGSQTEVLQDPGKMRPNDNPVIYGSHEKLSEDTGWQPSIAIEQTMADVIADWRSRQL